MVSHRPTVRVSDAHRPLTPADLRPSAEPLRVGRVIRALETIDSTNTFLRQHASELGDGAVAWAEHQAAGRGRQGRRWESPRGAGVLLSVLLREPESSALVGLAAIVGALAACEAVSAASLCRPVVRWPNDLYVNGRKLGGVLAECFAWPDAAGPPGGAMQSATRCVGLVIGVGINCLQQAGHFDPTLRESATSLEIESREPVDRATVARALLERLDAWCAACAASGGRREVLSAWKRHCSELGSRIVLDSAGRTYAGTIIDVTDEGDLLVQLDEGGRAHFAAATTTRRH